VGLPARGARACSIEPPQDASFIWTTARAPGAAAMAAAAAGADKDMITAKAQPLDFQGDGPRIPMIVVSPHAKGGKISHVYNDHASFVKLSSITGNCSR
jgi:phospholipase C